MINKRSPSLLNKRKKKRHKKTLSIYSIPFEKSAALVLISLWNMLADFINPDHFKISNEKAYSLHIVEGYEGVDH
jgi:hypothetical protein